MTTTDTEIAFSFATIRKLDEGMIENIIHQGVKIDIEQVLEIKRANKKITNGDKYAVLVSAEEFSNVTKKARELSASKEFVQNTVAKALLVEFLGHKIVGNFYLNVNKPHIKTKIFTDRLKALDWLYLQLKNET